MSPATATLPAVMVTEPLATRSPVTPRDPLPLTVIAEPDAPPHPAWLRAATAGVKRWLLTSPLADAPSVGEVPLVSTRANWSCRDRVAERVNRLPCGPLTRATSVNTVPSEQVQVTVQGLAPG